MTATKKCESDCDALRVAENTVRGVRRGGVVLCVVLCGVVWCGVVWWSSRRIVDDKRLCRCVSQDAPN